MIDLNPHRLGTVRRILAAHVPACEIRAFSSRATWTAKDYSDLDLAIVGAAPLEWGVLGRLKEAFEVSDLPMRVDVHDWHTIPARFRAVIERTTRWCSTARTSNRLRRASGNRQPWARL